MKTAHNEGVKNGWITSFLTVPRFLIYEEIEFWVPSWNYRIISEQEVPVRKDNLI